MERTATFDTTGKYRYSLGRNWDINNNKKIVFVMLNPSTADDDGDDPTTKRCINFAKSWGFGSLEIVNLFAYRTPKYNDLKELTMDIAIGPENEIHINKALESADKIVVAWGENCTIHKINKSQKTKELFTLRKVYCLGTTLDGYPRHPLYIRKDKGLEVYSNF